MCIIDILREATSFSFTGGKQVVYEFKASCASLHRAYLLLSIACSLARHEGSLGLVSPNLSQL